MTALIMPRSLRRGAAAPSSGVVAATASWRAGHSSGGTGHHSAAAPTPSRPVTARASALHLTRRGRLLLIGLPFVAGAAALLVVAAVFLLPATVNASTDPVGSPVTRSVTVQADQSLWEIAVAADPQRDTREVMSDIAELNGLSSPQLSAGQVLEVPAH